MAAPVPAQTVTNDDTVLKQIIIFGRHGVRSPVISPADYAKYSPRPYPDFGVIQPGFLTVHGQQAEVLLGAYYRSYLLFEGLLTGDAGVDLARSYFRSNSIQRSNLTATKLGAGLFNGATVPVHSYPLNQPDPVFDPVLANVADVNPVRAANAVREIYNSGTTLASAYSGEFSLIRSVLFNYQNGMQPPPATPPGITDPTIQPIPLDAITTLVYTGNAVDEGGLAQVQSSNAAAHILRSMKQAVLSEMVPGAFGDATTRVITVISSDAYVTGLAGLLSLHWQLPGYQPDFCAPGGALVFELRQSRRSGEYLVRAFFTSQSFDQLRNLTPLTLTAPPETIQLSIPGGSKPGATLDVKFEIFQKLLRDAIGPQYVQNPALEVPPGVLAGVPGQ